MKNKNLIYILVPLVIVIWGLIVFRIIKQIHHSGKPLHEKISVPVNDLSRHYADSVVLILKYRDPFLNGITRKRMSHVQSSSVFGNNANLTTIPKPALSFPDTRYSGLVVNSKSKHKLGLLRIGNLDFLVQEGDVVTGEKIIKLYSDSVIIGFKNSKKTFLKN